MSTSQRSVRSTAPTRGRRSGIGAPPSGATTAALPAPERTGNRADAMMAIGALAVVLVAVTALVATGTMGQFLGWAWERHANVLSWYIRPLFVLPLALFSYRRSVAGIALTLTPWRPACSGSPPPRRWTP